jgi:hypothetical protein
MSVKGMLSGGSALAVINARKVPQKAQMEWVAHVGNGSLISGFEGGYRRAEGT